MLGICATFSTVPVTAHMHLEFDCARGSAAGIRQSLRGRPRAKEDTHCASVRLSNVESNDQIKVMRERAPDA